MKASHKVGIALVAVCIVYVGARAVIQHNENAPAPSVASAPEANNAPFAGTALMSSDTPTASQNAASNPQSPPYGAIGMQAAPQSPNGGAQPVTATNTQLQFPGTGSQADWNEALAMSVQASRQFAGQQYDQAYSLYQQAIKKYPYDSHFYNNMAVVCYQRNQQGDLAEGEKLSQEALRLKPDEWSYWNNFGRGLGADNKIQDARSAFAKALECNPPAGQASEIKQNIAILDQALQGGH